MSYDLIALLITLSGGILMLVLPRKWAIAPFLLVSIFIPLGQFVLIGGLHFYMSRILILFGCMRLALGSHGEHSKLNAIDKIMILWVVCDVAAKTLLWQTGDALVNRLGFAFTALGTYFLVRYFVRDFEDVRRLIKSFVLISVMIAAAMFFEKMTGRNAFSVFGGVPAISEVRAGVIRSQGPFEHSILAGTFGAILLPMFVSIVWGTRKNRALAFLGIGSATAITVLSASSGPVLSYVAGIVGLCMWPFRNRMRLIRWGILFTVVGLQLVMKAPVWALIARVGVVDGSTAYHRAMLVDQFIRNLDQWWLLGIKSTQAWGPSFMVMHDVTNQYVGEGVEGGLITLVLFLFVIAWSFRGVGQARQSFENQPELERLCWAVGAALLVNVAAFMGISYFDQTVIVWYALIAVAATLATLAETAVDTPSISLVSPHSPEADLRDLQPEFAPQSRRSWKESFDEASADVPKIGMGRSLANIKWHRRAGAYPDLKLNPGPVTLRS